MGVVRQVLAWLTEAIILNLGHGDKDFFVSNADKRIVQQLFETKDVKKCRKKANEVMQEDEKIVKLMFQKIYL